MPLFKESISELNKNKIELLHWLEFYKSINDLPEEDRPRKEVIEDDSLCDNWLQNYFHKRKMESKGIGKKRKRDYDDQIIFNEV